MRDGNALLWLRAECRKLKCSSYSPNRVSVFNLNMKRMKLRTCTQNRKLHIQIHAACHTADVPQSKRHAGAQSKSGETFMYTCEQSTGRRSTSRKLYIHASFCEANPGVCCTDPAKAIPDYGPVHCPGNCLKLAKSARGAAGYHVYLQPSRTAASDHRSFVFVRINVVSLSWP